MLIKTQISSVQSFPVCVYHGAKIAPGHLKIAKSINELSRAGIEQSITIRSAIRDIEGKVTDTREYVSFLEVIQGVSGLEASSVVLPGLREAVLKGKKTLQDLSTNLEEASRERGEITSLFFRDILKPENAPSFFSRIEKLWTHSSAEKLNETGSQLLEKYPNHIIINKAIEEELILLFLENLIWYSIDYQSGSKESMACVREIYNWMPRIYQYHMGLSGSLELDEVEEIFDEENANLEKFIHAARVYHQCLSTLHPNLDLLCDETVKHLFFKVSDAQGKVRAHLLGSFHSLNVDLLRFRRVIRQAYHVATAVLVERDMTRNKPLSSSHIAHAEYSLDSETGQYYAFMDGLFLYEGLERDKWVIGLEDQEEEKNGNPMEIYDRPSYFEKNADVQEQMDSLSSRTIRQGTLDLVKEQVLPKFLAQFKAEYRDEVLEKLITQRNLLECKEIVNFFERHPLEQAFIVLGAGHLIDYKGSEGLLSLLQKKGYTIEQIT